MATLPNIPEDLQNLPVLRNFLDALRQAMLVALDEGGGGGGGGGDIKSDGSVDFAANESMALFKLTNLGAPTSGGDATNKTYVDTQEALDLRLSGSRAMTGALNMNTNFINNVIDPTLAQDAATKNYVDTHDKYAATFIVHPTAARATHTTIEAAVAAVPVGGADIYVHEGTYAPPVTINLPIDRDVRIRGAGAIGITQITIPTTGGGGPSPLFSVAVSATAEYAFSGFKATGDNTFQQSLIKLSSAVEVSFEDVEVIDTRDIVVTSTTPEVIFTHCKITFTTFSTLASFWRGTGVGGKLVWNYVDASFNADSTEAILGSPDWTVTASYIGGPPANGIYRINVALWQGFNLDKAEVYIIGAGSRIVNLQGIDVSLRINNNRTTIANSVFIKDVTFDEFVQINGNLVDTFADVIVSGCTFDRSGAGGFSILVDNVAGPVIDSCVFRNQSSAPIFLGSGLPATKATVTSCRCESPGVPMVVEGGSDVVGIYDANFGFGASTISGTQSIVESENFRNVRTWGATGNGTTNDTTAIQAAINSLPVLGGTLFFPPGTYKITSTLTLPNKPVTIKGSGDSAIIDVTSGSFAAFTVPTGLTTFRNYAINDLKILGGADGVATPVGGPVVGATLNDTFASAPSVTGANGSFAAGSTVGFTAEGGEPTILGNPVAKSGWLEWTAPASGTATIDLSGSSFDTLLAVYTGVSVGALTLIVADDDAGAGLTSLVVFSAVIATSYKFKVDGFGGASGSVTVTMSLLAGAAATTNSIVSIQDTNAFGMVSLTRVNTESMKRAVTVTAGDTSFTNMVQITMEDCWFRPAADNTSCVIHAPNTFFGIEWKADRIRFIDADFGTKGGSIVEYASPGVYTDVEAYIVDSIFNIASDSTFGTLYMANCSIYSVAPTTLLFMYVLGSITFLGKSSLINCKASGQINFNFAEAADVVGGEYENCALVMFGTDPGGSITGAKFNYGPDFLTAIDTACQSLLIQGCQFVESAAVIGGRYINMSVSDPGAQHVIGCVFEALSAGSHAAISVSVTAGTRSAFISNCYFKQPNVPPWKEVVSTDSVISSNNFFTSTTLAPTTVGANSRMDGVQAGDARGAGSIAFGWGRLTSVYTNVGNVGSGTDDLQTYTIPANTLNISGRTIRIKAWGSTANNANAKTVTLEFGGQTVMTQALTASIVGTWRIDCEIIKTGASTQKIFAELLQLATIIQKQTATAGTQIDTAGIIVKCTGTATSNDDIVQEGLIVEIS